MIYKPYKKYKDSGVEWIGEIPEDWEIVPVKKYLKFLIGGTPSTSREEYFEGDNIWVSISDLNDKDVIHDSKTKISDEAIQKSNVKKIPIGSLLFSFKLSVGLTAFTGAELYTNEAIASFLPNKTVSLNFFKYILGRGFENNGFENIYGAKLFNTDLIKEARFQLPETFDEQEKIANFLDKKTLAIDKAIEKNKKLIELLEEKRTSLINHVVTKGLNPNAKMKDSGVVWIGEIPEDWNLKKLKYNLNNITDGSHISVNILSEGYPYVTVSDLNEINEIIDLENCKRISKQDYDLLVRNGCQPNRGDILFSQIGTIGLVVPVKRNNFVLLSSLAILTPSDNVIQRWLIHYLRSEAIKNQWRIWMAGGAIKRITLDHISNFIIVVPSLNEQERISNFFDKKTLAVDKTIEKNKKLIELLEEYKKSLINHACTGKLNVLKSQS